MRLKSMEMLKVRMQHYCCCYECDFQSITETQEDDIGQNLQENVQFIQKDLL